MKAQNTNRTRIIGLRLTTAEYARIEKKWKATTCRKLSDYVRRSLFEKPVVTTYRNRTQDDLMSELARLRTELNAVGNNLNQAVKKLHTLNQIPEFRSWLTAFEVEKSLLENKVDEIQKQVKKIVESWLP